MVWTVRLLLALSSREGLSSPTNATAAKADLLSRLTNLSSEPSLRFLFGQQERQAKDDDIFKAVRDYPALSGFNFASLTQGDKPMTKTMQALRNAVKRGAIITAHFPVDNPLGGDQKTCQGNPMRELVPGGKANAKWHQWLDIVATAARSVSPTPILFRPFHENYLSNWWGEPCNVSVSEYKGGWQYTFQYLQDVGKVDNLLWVYAPDRPTVSIASGDYSDRYPGDDYVDVVAFDHYDNPPKPHHCRESSPDFIQSFVADCRMVATFARKHGKVPAIAEFGVKKGVEDTLDANWWQDCFLNPLAQDPIASKVAYALTWANSDDQHFTPLPGNFTFNSFLNFYRNTSALFLSDLDPTWEIGTDVGNSPPPNNDSRTIAMAQQLWV